MRRRYVIIGNGPAGTGAAARIRALDADGEITILSAEPDPHYTRIRLVEYLAGTLPEERLVLRAPAWYRERGISLRLATPAAGIRPPQGEVELSGGGRVAYDRLLVATGGIPVRPPLPGVDLPGVFTLRTLADARALSAWAGASRRAVVLGGGLLGLEAGAALARRGLPVTVAEVFPRLLPRQLDGTGAAILQGRLEGLGLSFVLGAKASLVTGRDRVEGVALDDGRHLPGDLLLISAGIRPAASLLEPHGGVGSQGITVDDRLRTVLPEVWAAGDCAEHRGRAYGIWPAAEEQGRTAGILMAGGEASYGGTSSSNSLKVAGIDLVCEGEVDPKGELESRVESDPSRGTYRKAVIRQGRVVGRVQLGRPGSPAPAGR